MGRESCWKCKRLRTDVQLHACDERLCKPCAKYNDACLKYRVFPKWDVVLLGQYPSVPGCLTPVDDVDTGDVDIVNATGDEENMSEYAENLRVNMSAKGDEETMVKTLSSDDTSDEFYAREYTRGKDYLMGQL